MLVQLAWLVATSVVLSLLVPPLVRAIRRVLATADAPPTPAVDLTIADLEGGSPQHPIDVASAAVVETRAASATCDLCDERMRVERHDAEVHAGETLRVVTTTCTACDATRRTYFRVHTVLH